MSIRTTVLLAGALSLATSLMFARPLAAQEGPPAPEGPPAEGNRGGPPIGESVFNGDFLTVGIGAGLSTSYTGSDDYRVFPLPIIQGSYKGVDFSPRPAGLAVDFIPDVRSGPSFDAGVAFRVRSDRVDQIKDEVVVSLGELDRAVEVGPTAGVSFPGVLNRFDSISVNVDALWDIAGAHSGMTFSPSVSYFTPLSRGTAVSIGASATFIDDNFADYYFSVSPADTVASGGVLPAFQAEGGLQSVGVNVFLAVDLNGDATDGGLSLVGIGGYSRLMNDAKDTPLTSVRGSANQFLIGAGLGYTF